MGVYLRKGENGNFSIYKDELIRKFLLDLKDHDAVMKRQCGLMKSPEFICHIIATPSTVPE